MPALLLIPKTELGPVSVSTDAEIGGHRPAHAVLVLAATSSQHCAGDDGNVSVRTMKGVVVACSGELLTDSRTR